MAFLYRIYERNGKYYLGSNRKAMEDSHPLAKFFTQLKYNELHEYNFNEINDIMSSFCDDQSPSQTGIIIITSENVLNNGLIHNPLKIEHLQKSTSLDEDLNKMKDEMEIARALISGHLKDGVKWPIPDFYRQLEMTKRKGRKLNFRSYSLGVELLHDLEQNSPKDGVDLALSIIEQFLLDTSSSIISE